MLTLGVSNCILDPMFHQSAVQKQLCSQSLLSILGMQEVLHVYSRLESFFPWCDSLIFIHVHIYLLYNWS